MRQCIAKELVSGRMVGADAAYDFPIAHRYLGDLEISFFVRPQPFHDRTNAELKRDAFRCDEQQEPEYREALKLRQIWCEGTFAAQKRDHNLTRVLRRGLEAAEDNCLLSATALNLKKMVKYTK